MVKIFSLLTKPVHLVGEKLSVFWQEFWYHVALMQIRLFILMRTGNTLFSVICDLLLLRKAVFPVLFWCTNKKNLENIISQILELRFKTR